MPEGPAASWDTTKRLAHRAVRELAAVHTLLPGQRKLTPCVNTVQHIAGRVNNNGPPATF